MNKSLTQRSVGRDHMKQLIRLAQVDGEVPQETGFINRAAEAWGVTPAELNRIRRNPETVRDRPPTDREGRLRQLYDLIMLVLSDGRVTDDEKHIAHARARQIGFSHKDVESLISILTEQVGKKAAGSDTGKS